MRPSSDLGHTVGSHTFAIPLKGALAVLLTNSVPHPDLFRQRRCIVEPGFGGACIAATPAPVRSDPRPTVVCKTALGESLRGVNRFAGYVAAAVLNLLIYPYGTASPDNLRKPSLGRVAREFHHERVAEASPFLRKKLQASRQCGDESEGNSGPGSALVIVRIGLVRKTEPNALVTFILAEVSPVGARQQVGQSGKNPFLGGPGILRLPG